MLQSALTVIKSLLYKTIDLWQNFTRKVSLLQFCCGQVSKPNHLDPELRSHFLLGHIFIQSLRSHSSLYTVSDCYLSRDSLHQILQSVHTRILLLPPRSVGIASTSNELIYVRKMLQNLSGKPTFLWEWLCLGLFCTTLRIVSVQHVMSFKKTEAVCNKQCQSKITQSFSVGL